MSRTTEIKAQQKKERRQTFIGLAVIFACVIIGALGFLRFYDSFIDGTLYRERLSQMREVTTQLFSGLEDVIKNQWRMVDEQCRNLQDAQPQDWESFRSLMERQVYLADLDTVQSNIVAVDDDGAYYTQKGKQGLLQEREYLLTAPEQVNYISNSMISNQTRMVFLRRLDNPVTMQDGDSTITLLYYGISQNMEELNPYFECSAYSGNNSVYVVDDNGLKLFSSSSSKGDLLKGFNVYTTLKGMDYLHDSSFDITIKELQEKGIAYSNALLEGTELYYSLYHMDNSAWTLIFLVPSQYVATNTVELVNMTVRLIMTFAVAMLLVSVASVFWILRRQQKLALDVERKNNAELEKLNVKLKAASDAKTDFLSNMSHDIRTPMNAIVGITSLMEHEKGLSDKMENYIQKVQLSSHHLLGLINDILDMSRIESKEVHLNVEEVSLAEQIGQIDSMIRAQTNEHHQNFHIHVNEIVHEYLIGDGVRFRQILLNLLSNAVKYTPNGGDITLDFAEVPCKKAEYAKFVCAVTDNGYGMTPEFLEHIFEPFTRAENSVTNKVQGTGLGMAITKNIVELMGGKIHVSSEIGRGSRFEVTLTMKINKHKESMLNGERILLVSSEPQLVKNIKASLSETAVEFFAVSTEDEAVGWLNKEGADIILISGCLYNMTLKETIQVLRRCAKNATMIFCVDYIQDEHMQEKIAGSGVDGIVLRPFFLSNLEIAIARTKTLSVSDAENESILKGMRFLCAEDNELNAEILQEILSMYGATCTIYPNGEEIVDAFRDVRPEEYDAILMDVQMPKMNGLEATRAIRNGSNPLGKTIPIIAMTANAFSEDVQHCIGAGMDAHIAKPLDIAVLEKTLRGLAGGGR